MNNINASIVVASGAVITASCALDGFSGVSWVFGLFGMLTMLLGIGLVIYSQRGGISTGIVVASGAVVTGSSAFVGFNETQWFVGLVGIGTTIIGIGLVIYSMRGRKDRAARKQSFGD